MEAVAFEQLSEDAPARSGRACMWSHVYALWQQPGQRHNWRKPVPQSYGSSLLSERVGERAGGIPRPPSCRGFFDSC